MFNIIIATDLFNGIGKNNILPWNFNSDMIHFKKNTLYNDFNDNNILIMGHNTFKSLKVKLNNRIYFVITNHIIEDVITFTNFNDAYVNALTYNTNIWVIGGSQIYNYALNHWACNKIYYTLIKGNFNCDTYFNINNFNINWIKSKIIKDINNNDKIEYELEYKIGKRKHNIELKYLKLLYNVLNKGNFRNTRNSLTFSSFGENTNNILSCNLEDGFPLLTTKKMFWRGIVEELLFFIRGDTNTLNLSSKGIKIWENNTSLNFLKNIKLDYNVGDMGPMYGYQWRQFNKHYKEYNNDKDNNNDKKYIDQLKNIINEINNNPFSRRLIMTDFNPIQVDEGVLYPCHSIIIQFYIDNIIENNITISKLSCNMYQRSGDLFLGIPFNIASTALLLCIISKLTNKKPHIMNLIIGDAHIYDTHKDVVLEQLKRVPFTFCKLNMKDFKTLEEVESSSYNDFIIENYNSHSKLLGDIVP
jgi:dihydrofolate reductase/thymidylate synthase